MSQPVDLTIVSQTFPNLDDAIVSRDNFLDTVDTIFESGVRCVTLEGPSGIGKTTLAAQYARRHRHRTLSLFIRSANRWGHDPEVLRQDLCGQLHWVLQGNDVPSGVQADDALLRDLLFSFRKQLRIQKLSYLFVVDGLNDIPERSAAHRQLILDLLPLDFDQCRFLFTNAGPVALPLPAGLTQKSYPLTTFGLEESRRYLSSVIGSHSAIQELHTICRGIPAHLASVRRSVIAGQAPEDLLANVTQSMAPIFENEWRTVTADDPKQVLLLGILAHDEGIHRIPDLARLVGDTPEGIAATVRRFSFLSVDDHGEVEFTSDSFRRFAVERLSGTKREVQERLIDDLMANPESDIASDLLPDRLRQAGRYQELLDYLSPEHLLNTLQRGASFSPVRSQVELGVEAAIRLERDADLMRFSMQQSALADDFAIDVCRAEIEARIALGDHRSALAIANSVPLKEDRLHLLAVVAKRERLKGLTPDPALIEQIHSLFRQVDQQALARHSGEIASDLIFSAPELAIELMDNRAQASPDAQDRRTFVTSVEIPAKKDPQADSLHSLRAQVTDPRLQRFLAASALLVGGLSAAEVLREVETIPKPHDRLFFLRQWAGRNRDREDAAVVVDYALKLAIKTTEYTPNARDIRQLAAPVPFIRDYTEAARLISSFDAQRGSVEKYGPTADYVRLQLLLAEAENRYDHSAACARLLDVYYYILGQVADASVKVECLGHLLAALSRIDTDGRIEKEEQLESVAESDFREALTVLLNGIGEQLQVCKGTIEALAVSRFDLAIELVSRLNVEWRRDRARVILVRAASSGPPTVDLIASLPAAIQAIANPEVQDEAVAQVFDALGEDTHDGLSHTTLAPLVARAGAIRDPHDRCTTLAKAYRLYPADERDKAAPLLEAIADAWNAIDPAWAKISSGFRIAADMAECAPEVAKEFLANAEHEKQEMLRQSPGVTSTFLAALGISVSAFTGLLRRNLDTDTDIARLAELIKQVPSDEKQVEIWGDIAERYAVNKRSDRAHEIVAKYVRSVLDKANQPERSHSAYLAVVPVLYRVAPVLTKSEIIELPTHARDDAVETVCSFVMRKKPQSEPMDVPRGFVYDLSYDEIVELIELLQISEHDAFIYATVESIADALDAKAHRRRYTQQQRNEVARRLEELGKVKMPSQRFITHEGFRIILDGQVARIRKSESAVWEQLLDRARALSNISDRAYVLGVLAGTMPPREAAKHKNLLPEALQTLNQIPAFYDRVERLKALAQTLWHVDQEFAKELCKTAVSASMANDSPDLARAQREVVDFAHRMDPDFAAALAARLDDDPARVQTRAMIKRQTEVLDAKRALLDANGDVKPSASPVACASAAWLSLAVLNAGRCETRKPSHLRELVRVAATLPLHESYPIIAWAVGNVINRFSDTDQAQSFIRPMFEATLLTCQMSARMTARASGALTNSLVELAPKSMFGGTVLIRAGERTRALDYIREWIERSASEYLKICDPYFGLEDLELLRLVVAAQPTLQLRVLTSLKHQKNENMPQPYEQAYRDYWRSKLSEQEPPDTEVVLVGARGSDAFPIHDRWWLSRGTGLRVGTSFKSLGAGKDSDISVLSPEEVRIHDASVSRFLDRIEKEHQGSKLQYTLFTL